MTSVDSPLPGDDDVLRDATKRECNGFTKPLPGNTSVSMFKRATIEDVIVTKQ
jgi:hypothetical protein